MFENKSSEVIFFFSPGFYPASPLVSIQGSRNDMGRDQGHVIFLISSTLTSYNTDMQRDLKIIISSQLI